MSQNVIRLLVAVFLVGFGFFVGRSMGTSEAYKKTSGALAEQYFRSATTNLNGHLDLLEMMQSNQGQKAAEKLERLVDADIMALKRRQDIPAEVAPQVRQAIQRAEDFRKKQPPPAAAK